MKKIVLFFIVSFFVQPAFAQNYTPVDNGSDIKFSIKNFGLNVTGSFKGLKGKISFNPTNLSASSIVASLESATINTGNDSRNNHLKKEEYLDIAKFPVLSFASFKITNASGAGSFNMEGKITIRGVTKTILFPFTVTPKGEDYLFAGEFKLNRRDFGVGGNSFVMSDNLTVTLSVLAKKN